MNAALLTGANADCLTVLHVAYRIGLGIFEGDERDDKIATSLGGKILVLGGDVGEERIVVEIDFITSLFESNTIDHLALNGSRAVGWIHLNDAVGSLALGLKNGEGLGFVAWGNDTITHFAVDETGSSHIAYIGECNEVAKR